MKWIEEYIEHKLIPIPIKYGEKKPPLLKGWTDLTLKKFLKNNPFQKKTHFNVGLVCGKESGIFVIDVDKPELWWNDIIEENGEPQTLVNLTPNGKHYIFKYDERLEKYKGKVMKETYGMSLCSIYSSIHFI